VSMRGFKEDFDAWRTSLTPEEEKLVSTQARYEFDKNFRKSDDFTNDLPAEKTESFGKILGKFFDSEVDDYKKEMRSKRTSPPSVLDKKSEKDFEFKLTHHIVMIDRDAERRYQFAMQRNTLLQAEGHPGVGESSPMMEEWVFANNDSANHEANVYCFNTFKGWADRPDCPPLLKKLIQEVTANGLPPMGEHAEFLLPVYLMNQVLFLDQTFLKTKELMAEGLKAGNVTQADADKYTAQLDEMQPEWSYKLSKEFFELQAEIEQDVQDLKDIHRSKLTCGHKTKADVARDIWKILPEIVGKPVAPLDPEVLAGLEEIPASEDPDYLHPWAVADKLYKSVAIDSFGQKFLLGVYESPEECQKVFDGWNDEYKKAKAEMHADMQEWSKQENARLDKDPRGRERIQKVLEEAKAGGFDDE